MIAKFAKKINEILIQKEIVQKEDAELYQYGIENGIVVAGNLLASGIFGIVTGRPGLVLVFLLFLMGFSLLSASEFLPTEKWRCAKQ